VIRRPGASATPSTSKPSASRPSTSPIVTVPLPVLVGAALGLVALGFVVGAGGCFLQARTVEVGVRWPVGALLVLLVLAAVGLSAGLLARSRLGPVMVTAGWVISVLVFLASRPEGDVVIGANLPGYLYLLGGVFVLGVVCVVPYSELPAPAEG
jgi:hypothetical protein